MNPVTAARGSIGVYLDGIGTVTPIFTDSITSRVTGVVTTLLRKSSPLNPAAFGPTRTGKRLKAEHGPVAGAPWHPLACNDRFM